MSEQRFAERFGALLLARGWHCLPAEVISSYGWEDMSWIKMSPCDDYDQRKTDHVEAVRKAINWPALQESDFEIGWWTKFCGSFVEEELVQLIKVVFPLRTPFRSSLELFWAAELTLSEAISAVCNDMIVKD